MPVADGVGATVSDYDRDSIHILPLAIMPIANQGLREARLIRNVRLEPRIELFRESGVGSGQISIAEIPDFFGDAQNPVEDDVALIAKLGELPAFDPYSLRMALRKSGVNLVDLDMLQLSDAKKDELFPLMQNITRPLIAYLYGGRGVDPSDTDSLLQLIANPNVQRIRVRLNEMSAALGVPLPKLPEILEEYGDIYLALSYYRRYFLYVLPVVDRLTDWIVDVSDSSVITRDANMVKTLKQSSDVMKHVLASVRQRFEIFDKKLEIRWDNMNVRQFNDVRAMIGEHQQTLAEVLCGLTVKIYEWEHAFPNGGGSPEKRSDFVATQIRPGLDRIWATERRAPKFQAA